MKITQYIFTISLLTICSIVSSASAEEGDYITISAFLGTRLNQDIDNRYGGNNDAKLSSELTEAFAIGWKYDTKAEGQLLFSNSKQEVSTSGIKFDTYVQYLHLGGKVLFTNETPFSTNIGVGIGVTKFDPTDSRYNSKTALSAHMSGGIRYQINDNFALRSDLQLYATRFNGEKNLFCKSNECLVKLDNSFYFQTELLMGIEYKF